MTPERLLEVARATITAAPYCFLITLGPSGAPQARLMQPFEPDEELTIYFGCSPRSRKVQEIIRNSGVSVAYHAEETAYVVLRGTALIERDVELRRKYWRPDWLAFFPAGPDGDDYILIRFVPDHIELMSFPRHVTPEPYGLRPAVLIRAGQSWAVETA